MIIANNLKRTFPKKKNKGKQKRVVRNVQAQQSQSSKPDQWQFLVYDKGDQLTDIVRESEKQKAKIAPKTPNNRKNMPQYPNLVNNTTAGWGTFYGQTGGQNFRGRYGGGRGMRGGRGGFGGFRRGPPRPKNSKEDIPFKPLADDAPTLEFVCSPENITAFHGFDSVFTPQHNFPLCIDGDIYTSCDHYYQIQKVKDLIGSIPEKLEHTIRNQDGKYKTPTGEAPVEKKSASALAKEILKEAKIEKAKLEEWRNTKGLQVIQNTLLTKVSQSAHLRGALKESGDSILVHAYAGDSIYGTGCTVVRIKKWLEELKKAGVKTLKIPAEFPLDENSVQNCPTFADGRNILGVILMQLREKLRKNAIHIMDMNSVFDALRVNNSPDTAMDTTACNSFIINSAGSEIKQGVF
ncbi:unnamed protein product [Caenorhabditis bovis]|uniref:NADAR domain-containing protein n=1 Tax=Caenorhabditis bovis TaxID=2654633 RepID=A0A8S1ETM5_9PELO|nr:unnamed protein product [Caenorhabditis bovis]